MKRSLNYLRKLAQSSTSFRGHRMVWHNPYGRADGPFSQIAHCKRCKMEVQIMECPPPNGIDIGGEAVAQNCPSVSVSYSSVNQNTQGSMTTLGDVIANSRVTNEEAG